MITVHGIRPASGGFGDYDLQEGVEMPDMETTRDYIEFVMDQQSGVEPIGEGDEDFGEIDAADGHIHHQDGGKLIGWRDREGNVTVEVVFEGE